MMRIHANRKAAAILLMPVAQFERAARRIGASSAGTDALAGQREAIMTAIRVNVSDGYRCLEELRTALPDSPTCQRLIDALLTSLNGLLAEATRMHAHMAHLAEYVENTQQQKAVEQQNEIDWRDR